MVMTMSDPLLFAGGLIILLSLVGIFLCSLSEAAFLGMTEMRQRRMAESRHPNARLVLRLLSDSNYLSAIIVGMNLFIIIISTVMTVMVRHQLQDGAHWLEEGIHVGMVLVILVFAELTPKTYGGMKPERVALSVVRIVMLMATIFRPAVHVLSRVSRPLVRLVNQEPRNGQWMTIEEIRAAADVSEEEGLVDAEEAQMLDSVIDLGETQVHEIMVPRVNIVAVEESASAAEFAATASRSGHSRIPIYSESLDNITGIVYVNDILRRLGTGDTGFPLREIARPPFYVPDTKRIDDLLRELRERRVHIAIVVDEFGGTDGIATIEDILEELVGEIADEHDLPSHEFQLLAPGEALVDGKLRLEDINERLCITLPEGQYETVGGLVSGLAGHIPSSGESFEVEGARLIVEESDGQHVERIRIVVGSRESDD
jgi:putative hemolysin